MERWGRFTGLLFQIELLLILVAGALAARLLNDRMLLVTGALGAMAWLALAWAQMQPNDSRFAQWRGTLQFAACWLIFPMFKGIRAVYIQHPLDAALLALDRRLWGGASLPERVLDWEHPWLTEILSAGYFLFYFVVLLPVIAFSIRRRSGEAKAFFTGLTLMYLVGFIGYVLVPAGGPYLAFPETFPYPPKGGPVTAFLVSVVKNGITGMDVFPSLHAGIGSYVLGFFALGGYRRIALLLAPIVMALIIATIYLRYHYGIDVLCGLALAAAVLIFVQRYRRECYA
jgi:membrane-associated phospholipid phosphatase